MPAPCPPASKKPQLPAKPRKGMQLWVQTGSHWCVGTSYTVSEVNSRSFYVTTGGARRRHLSAVGRAVGRFRRDERARSWRERCWARLWPPLPRQHLHPAPAPARHHKRTSGGPSQVLRAEAGAALRLLRLAQRLRVAAVVVLGVADPHQ